MKGIPQGRYTKEFREEAVKLVREESISLLEAGRTQRPVTEIEMELA